MEEAFDEAREDGGDHAHGEHVERDGEEDKGSGGAAAFWRMGSLGGFESDQFGLGEERVGFAPLGRILRRVWHVCDACESAIER